VAKFSPANPGGRPAGARNKLQSKFLLALAEDFEQHGAAALAICRIEEPARYIAIIASLMPKELLVSDNALGDLSDEEVHTLLNRIRETLKVIDVTPEKVALPALENK
jgi:hypothetical protein